ncbi:MAG TPA: hypothetical protein VI072_31205 [Polyangiaceae bacterium]
MIKKQIALGAFLVTGVSALGAQALDLKGSDTLFEITVDLIQTGQCGAGLSYIGGGSSGGEQALVEASQAVSPMSRALTAGRTCNFPDPPAGPGSAAAAEGIAFALDGLAVVASDNHAACDGAASDCNRTTDPNAGLKRTGSIGAYTLGQNGVPGWADVLRIVYGGAESNDGSNINARDCNSAVRRELVNNWGNLFESACAGCTQLQHAFRRNDLSGTTDVFVALLNLGSIQFVQTGTTNVRRTPFCNAVLPAENPITPAGSPSGTVPAGTPVLTADSQDSDPIRRTCLGGLSINAPGEQVCSAVPGANPVTPGSLGLVLSIDEAIGQASVGGGDISNAVVFPTAVCPTGRFVFRPAAPRQGALGRFERCPNGAAPRAGSCLHPVDAANNNCLNPRLNKPQEPGFGNADGRAYNLMLRTASGQVQTDTRGRPVTGFFNRIHATQPAVAGADATFCRRVSATEQIGCLVAASPCSLGFAGREGAYGEFELPRTGLVNPNTIALKVDQIDPELTCVQNLVTTPADATDDYPLSRKLYLTSMVGFESATAAEQQLARCFSGTVAGANLNDIVEESGFIRLPGTPLCEDFNEQTACGAAANNNACAGNPAGIVSNP